MGTVKWDDEVNREMIIIGTEDGNITGDATELIDFYNVFMEISDMKSEHGMKLNQSKYSDNFIISTKLALVNMIRMLQVALQY